jgi:hypothetical protein
MPSNIWLSQELRTRCPARAPRCQSRVDTPIIQVWDGSGIKVLRSGKPMPPTSFHI